MCTTEVQIRTKLKEEKVLNESFSWLPLVATILVNAISGCYILRHKNTFSDLLLSLVVKKMER